MTLPQTQPFLDTLAPASYADGGDGDGKPGWLDDLRQAGLDIYRRQGLPTPRVEAWKYTNLGGLTKIAFKPEPAPVTLDPGRLPLDRVLALDAHKLVFVNGRLDRTLSDAGDLPAGLRVSGLAALLAEDPARIEPLLGKGAALDDLPLAALNTGMIADGMVIEVAEDAVIERPLHVIAVSAALDGPMVFYPRLLVVVGARARLVLAESHVGLPDHPAFSNGVSEISLGEGAQLSHYRLIDGAADGYLVGTTLVEVGVRAGYESFTLELGGRLTRNEIRVTLAGEEGQARVSGGYAVRAGQHLDNTVLIDHAQPGATSRQLFKGVLDETGKAVFQGKILVRRGAQKTDGQQLHKALLLSRGAEVDTKPELEIYADDVVCGHGATAGEMDADQLFYLQARGLDEATARALLVEAFLEDVVGEVGDLPVRAAMIAKVRDWQRARDGAVWSE
ncbi:Fe-S cluster assembly protein SufD [Rhodospirillum rubrum]|uniref:FeS assembly protein SufD n=1 Tax=Rhodospirillum rubrum (strain ATCC 11170 / ATH 1.1.1 / DSM 467 / LMG 4362 / NCIMB 8255 / S1) TaxID=269796 RepID=Q2RR77_RHORT|nr:Fe-S cluster assembly protein SufD [Rhodospirillum rubrum]ABC23368.1 FeS assembly protein SufD [Rhodospirillum rubrum ATCC 11170]AEO49103.1 FeS assembly protein SufD [Rhodospirillum rubrum F11]MBK5955013.1 Fe-S cluster assembly protein SufD [Rhodospirillum rubrum]QXG79341.1 Fe-S cluster assembly protein SufD [Rhodospirillum rubrum]HAP99175.1 Fe-S cluster assembly protein SufD [Rhodospirillum rubrum]